MYNVRRLASQPLSMGRRGMAGIPPLLGDAAKLKHRLPLVKIVATIGPVSEQLPPLTQVFDAGMRIMRINFSHATYEEAGLRVRNLNACRGVNKDHGKDATGATTNMRAIMLDTQGPEIRTGSFDGVKSVELKAGQEVVITTDDQFRNLQTPDKLWISYKKLGSTVTVGSHLLVDDGLLGLKVTGRKGNDIVCTVQNNAVLGNKKGAFMPGLVVDLPAMSEKDKEDIKWGVQHDIDYIAASFVRKPADVIEIRDYCKSLQAGSHRPLPRIISKIESTEALANFDEILAVSDGIMVARGDLAVEIPMESLAIVQKEIVRRCNVAGKPVIVATQLLESMQKNPRPTRAEACDVANAVFDGTDCVMLSGESANGKYPTLAVDMMNRIVQQAELALTQSPNPPQLVTTTTKDLCAVRAMAHAAVQLSHAGSNVAGIVVNVHGAKENPLEIDETLVATLSSLRPNVPIFVYVPTYKAGRLLQMFRGVHPLLAPASGGRLTPAAIRSALQHLNLVDNHGALVCLHGSSVANMALDVAEASH